MMAGIFFVRPYQRAVYRVDALLGVRQAGLLRVFARRLFRLAREPSVRDAQKMLQPLAMAFTFIHSHGLYTQGLFSFTDDACECRCRGQRRRR